MAKRQKQTSLTSIWTKKARCESEADERPPPDESENSVEQPGEGASCSNSPHTRENASSIIQQDKDDALESQTTCTAHCCASVEKKFQPVDKATLDMIATEKRNFQPQWYKQFPWLTICLTYKKVFCLYCRYATHHHLLSFSKMGEKAFTETGFQNWKKALEKFKSHDGSHAHREALSKWLARGRPTISAQLHSI